MPVILISQPIMSAFGSGFSQGAQVLVWVTLSTILSTSIGVIGAAISSMGKMWHGFMLNCIWGAALLVFTYIFISKGAYGLSLAYVLSYTIHLISVTCYILIVLGGFSFKKVQ